jgi:hypothetical protein
MSQSDHREPQNQSEFVVVDSSQFPLVFINSHNEIFICADGVTKIVPAQQTGALDSSGQ